MTVIDIPYIFEPFRPAEKFVIYNNYDIDFDVYRPVIEWRGKETTHFLQVVVERFEVVGVDFPMVLNSLFRKAWTIDYKVPEREPHIILGEN